MTHPDPYIEEKKAKSDTWTWERTVDMWALQLQLSHEDVLKIKNVIRAIVKTQRIKDMEEIEEEYLSVAEMICAREAAIIERRDRAFEEIKENLRLQNNGPILDPRLSNNSLLGV